MSATALKRSLTSSRRIHTNGVLRPTSGLESQTTFGFDECP